MKCGINYHWEIFNFMTEIELKRQECVVYSRVVGYFAPVKNWNKAKKSEFNDREEFVINEENFKK